MTFLTQGDRDMRVEFCQIDARDDGYCGYAPCAFCKGRDGESLIRLDEAGPNLGALQLTMEREYLVRLKELQKEIETKYLDLASQLGNDPRPDDLDEYGHAMNAEQFDAAKQAALKAFPGEEADHYT